MESRPNAEWIQTYTGRQFWPMDPRPEDVCIEDIAHALSLQCRFTGHVRTFYSVADHSVRVAQLAMKLALESGHTPERAAEVERWGLLHDAPEAYLMDLATPVKRQAAMKPFRDAEERLMACIAECFGLTGDMPQEVKQADAILLATEARDLFARVSPMWKIDALPMGQRIAPMDWDEARGAFMATFLRCWPDWCF